MKRKKKSHQAPAKGTALPAAARAFDAEPVPPPEDPLLARVKALDPRRVRRVALLVAAALLACIVLPPRASQPLATPEKPGTVFFDQAGLTSPQFARDASTRLHSIELFQGVVYTDLQMPQGDLKAWTEQAATRWGVGMDRDDRGLVLFVFREPRMLRAEVGYGLEGQLPDAQIRQLLETHVLPAFAQERYEDGLEAWVEAVYEALGGDKAWVQLVHSRPAKGKAGWTDLWDEAWKEGSRLLPAVWREYLQGSVWERFVILLFASIPTGFALIGLTVFGLTLQCLVELPGKLRARREGAARRAAAAPNAATVAGLNQWKADLAAASARERETGPRWFEIVMGPPVALLCLGVVLFAFTLAPDRLTRQGRFGGGGVTLSWPAAPGR
ncbi:MAG: TPM domain-containing protein [Rubrivivax sp.]|nr:TPM domain-containing protein [Rubrivivax sp.]